MKFIGSSDLTVTSRKPLKFGCIPVCRNKDKESAKGRICCVAYHIRLVVFLVDFAPAKPSHNSLKRDLALFVSQNNMENNFRVVQTEIRTSK